MVDWVHGILLRHEQDQQEESIFSDEEYDSIRELDDDGNVGHIEYMDEAKNGNHENSTLSSSNSVIGY